MEKFTTYSFDCEPAPGRPDEPVSAALFELLQRLREMLSEDGGDHVLSVHWSTNVMTVELERD